MRAYLEFAKCQSKSAKVSQKMILFRCNKILRNSSSSGESRNCAITTKRAGKGCIGLRAPLNRRDYRTGGHGGNNEYTDAFEDLFQSTQAQTMLEWLPKISLNVLEWSSQSSDLKLIPVKSTVHWFASSNLWRIVGGKTRDKITPIWWAKLVEAKGEIANLRDFCYKVLNWKKQKQNRKAAAAEFDNNNASIDNVKMNPVKEFAFDDELMKEL